MSGTYKTQRRVVYRKDKNEQNNNNSPKNENLFKKIAGILGKTALAVFLVGIITVCIIVGAIAFYVIKVQNPGAVDLDSAKLNYTSVVYANSPSTGQPVEVQRLYSDENRVWVDLNKIPVNLQNAFVSTEDQRFYDHEGVDWKRTVSAFGNLFLHFYSTKQGGSTITQQLVKNVDNINSSKLTGKVQEILAALNTEKKYSKDEILQCYLNVIPLGENCNGVQAASLTYFGKDVGKLDLAECAMLAGITKSPETYDPFKQPDNNLARRKYVLSNMLNQGKITKQQYDQAANEKVVLNSKKVVLNKKPVQNYFVDQVISDVTNDLVTQKGYSRTYSQSLIYSQGLKIYTTMNPDVQSAIDEVYSNPSNFVLQSGSVKAQSAMIIMDYSGAVVAVRGGIGTKTANMILDRATQSKRQPGSSIKPLAVYAPAIDLNQITWSTMIPDSPITIIQDGKSQKWPKDDDYYLNYPISITQALAMSKNTVAVKVCQMLDPNGKRSFDFLSSRLDFTSLVKSRKINNKIYSDINLGIAIGALTDGVTPEEMAAGYQIFGNKGNYNKPYTYTKVVDGSGNVLLQNTPAPEKAISEDTAFIMNQLLQQVVLRSDGTAQYAKLGNMPVAAKTGTTTDRKDRWFVGETPYYIGAVWFGYDQPKPVNWSGTNPALLAWKNVMSKVSAKQPYKDFPACGSVVKSSYYTGTGLLAPNGGAGTAVGWYRASNLPAVGTPPAPKAPAASSSKSPAPISSSSPPPAASSSSPPPAASSSRPASLPATTSTVVTNNTTSSQNNG